MASHMWPAASLWQPVWHKSVPHAWLTAAITPKPSCRAAPHIKPSDVHASHPLPQPRTPSSLSQSPYDHLIPPLHPSASFLSTHWARNGCDGNINEEMKGWKKIADSCYVKRVIDCVGTFCSCFKFRCVFELIVFDPAVIFASKDRRTICLCSLLKPNAWKPLVWCLQEVLFN